MKPPPGMIITTHPTEGGRVPITITVRPPYCPCGWTCHDTPHPCSFSCLAHHPPQEAPA